MEIINLFIHWNVDPVIIDFGWPIRWYSLFFALGFIIGHYIMQKIMVEEGIDPANMDSLTAYMAISTIIGARLGHVLFYQPDYYLSNPIEILKIYEGGLASHGAAVAIIIALILYARTRPEQPFLWIIDRIVITVALAGCFIRLGNLMNSEILGSKTDVPWAFIFHRIDEVPRHAAQLYEAIFYLIFFVILYKMYYHYKEKTPRGLLFGWFLIMIFGIRILIEYIKEDQVINEQDLVLIKGLNQGQNLSVPFVLIGMYLVYRAYKNGPVLKSVSNGEEQ